MFRETVDAVARGERVFSPYPLIDTASEELRVKVLSDREFQVMCRLARGMKHVEIAAELFVSARTVDNQRLRVLRKLGLRNNAELTLFAVRNGFVDPK